MSNTIWDGITNVTGNIPLDNPPTWAILERRLIDLMNDAVEPLLEKYVNKDGSIMWPATEDHTGIDGLDDAYESFHNWPLFYALGGHEKFLHLSIREWEAITKQFQKYDTGFGYPMVIKEYEQGYDWFHQGEGYLFFYMLGLADPHNKMMRERAVKFAGFYMNEDPEVDNYDSERKLMRSPHLGSMGPGYRNFDHFIPWEYQEWKEYYGLPFQDVPGCTGIESIRDIDNATRMGQVMKERMSRGDVVVNLAVTGMVTNAYLYTGDNKYKEWVKEYVDAWIKRMEQNKGIIPDNVGLSGKIGEYNSGKWYGGYYGWTWPHGWHSIGQAVMIAAENATLLCRDPKYLNLPRSQMDVLIDHGIEVNGTLYVPHKYGDPGSYEYKLYLKNVLTEDLEPNCQWKVNKLLWKDGWFEFQPMDSRWGIGHLWYMSMNEEDSCRLKKLRNHCERDYERILKIPAKDQGGHEAAWIAYLQGEYPEYPSEILEYNLSQVYKRLAFMREDKQDPKTYGDSYLQARNPVTLEGLVQLTMGGPLPIYNGGLLMARIRYFDVQKNRPGLPQDIGALVEKLDNDRTVLTLVNLSATEPRELIIQAGAYGEHRFTDVSYDNLIDGDICKNTCKVDSSQLKVELKPGSQIRLDMGMKRFVNAPSYAFPWDDSCK